jgi:chromosomal replication initiator protein
MTSTDISQALWRTVQAELEKILSREDFQKWLAPVTCEGAAGDCLLLLAESDFGELWVNRNYQDLLNTQLTLAAGRPTTYKLRPAVSAVNTAPAATTQSRTATSTSASAAAAASTATSAASASSTATATATPRHAGAVREPAIKGTNTFENFIVAPENELAHAAAMAVATDPGAVYNPLFIYGATGLGKTHLLHAVAHTVLRRNARAHILYVTSEAFTNEYISGVQEGSLSAFRRHYREADLLLIDDIQFFAGKERTQEEFFHTFNELHNLRRQIVLTSDRPAREIATLEDRLVSRFGWGYTADIGAPRYETRIAILRQKAIAAGLEIAPDIIEFLASRIARNVRNLEGAIMKMHGYMKLGRDKAEKENGTPAVLTLDKVTELLHDMLAVELEEQISAEIIQKKVADYYRIPLVDMTSEKRTAQVAFPRQVAMYVCAQLTSMSLAAIGEAFGRRDHGTVIHARKTVENRRSTVPSVKRDVDYLLEKISNPRG